MKKIITIALALALAVSVVVLLFMHYKTAKTGFTIEWHEITPNMRAPLYEQLQNVSGQAFVPVIKPYVYATDPRVAHAPAEKRSLVEL